MDWTCGRTEFDVERCLQDRLGSVEAIPICRLRWPDIDAEDCRGLKFDFVDFCGLIGIPAKAGLPCGAARAPTSSFGLGTTVSGRLAATELSAAVP